MENAQNKPVQPRNIFEAINQNIFEMSQDNVATNQLVQGIAAKVDEIAAKVDAAVAKIDAVHAALYQPMPERPANEIPDSSPNDPGEEEGSENE